MTCLIALPDGWFIHPTSVFRQWILHASNYQSDTGGQLMVEEPEEPDADGAWAAMKAHLSKSLGHELEFVVLREARDGEDAVLVYQWRPVADAGLVRGMTALRTFGPRRVLVNAVENAGRPESGLLAALSSLTCSPIAIDAGAALR